MGTQISKLNDAPAPLVLGRHLIKMHMVALLLIQFFFGSYSSAAELAEKNGWVSSCQPTEKPAEYMSQQIFLYFEPPKDFSVTHSYFGAVSCRDILYSVRTAGTYSFKKRQIRFSSQATKATVFDLRFAEQLTQNNLCGTSWEVGKATALSPQCSIKMNLFSDWNSYVLSKDRLEINGLPIFQIAPSDCNCK